VLAIYSQGGGKKGGAHAWQSDSTNIGAISYLPIQAFEFAYHRTFRAVHQRNAILQSVTYALLPSDRFLHLLTKSPTLAQDRRTLNLDESQMQVFRELQGKIKDILLAIKALATARRKGQGGAGGRDSEFEEV
jgi:hypothetical protein